MFHVLLDATTDPMDQEDLALDEYRTVISGFGDDYFLNPRGRSLLAQAGIGFIGIRRIMTQERDGQIIFMPYIEAWYGPDERLIHLWTTIDKDGVERIVFETGNPAITEEALAALISFVSRECRPWAKSLL